MKTIISFISRMFLLAAIVITCFTNSGYSEGHSELASNISKSERAMMIFGDVNFDGIVDMSDFYIVSNDSNNFVVGSTITDLNGDTFTNLTDVLIVYNLL